MKYGVVIYHKNVKTVYPPDWIEYFVDSIKGQSDQDFSVYEYDYGGSGTSILNGKFENRKHFLSGIEANHADAMNTIYGKAIEDGCDVIFNTNVDDFYHKDRIKFQKIMLTKYDIVSSNYQQVHNGKLGRIANLHLHTIDALFENLNVVSNPCHAMRRRVFEKLQFDGSLIPYEDLEYWKQCVQAGFSIRILPDILHYYRVYSTQIGKTDKG